MGEGLRRYVAVSEGHGLHYAFDHCGTDPGGAWDITVRGAMTGQGLLVMAQMLDSATGFDGPWGVTMAMAGMEIDMHGWATLTFGPGGKGEFMIETATGTGSDGSATAEPNTEVYGTLAVTPEDCQPGDPPAP